MVIKEKTADFREEDGFTLLELLVALAILSVGLLGTAVLTTGIIRGNFFSKNITSATAVAQTTIEGAQRVGYTAVNTYVTDSSKVPPTVPWGEFLFPNPSNMKTISIMVSWNEANNAARSVTLQTILSQ